MSEENANVAAGVIDAPSSKVEAPKETKPVNPSTDTNEGLGIDGSSQKQQGESKAKEPEEKPQEKADAAGEQKKYKLTLPAEAYIDPEQFARIESYSRSKGLGDEQAQMILDYVETQAELESQQTAKWLEEVKNDKALGRENFTRTLEDSKRAFDRFGSPELAKALYETGWGNNPHVVRFFQKIGAAIKDDRFVSGSAPGAKRKDPAQVLFGSPNVQE